MRNDKTGYIGAQTEFFLNVVVVIFRPPKLSTKQTRSENQRGIPSDWRDDIRYVARPYLVKYWDML
jgi:hypothetical protein